MEKIIVNCETNETETIAMTQEEITERNNIQPTPESPNETEQLKQQLLQTNTDFQAFMDFFFANNPTLV